MALREILVAFGVTVDQTEIVSAQAGVEKLLDTFGRLVKSSAVVLGGKALANFVQDTIEAANHVSIMAARFGTTTEATQELMAVADASGVHFTQLLHGFRAINTAAERGASEFRELGVNVKDSHGQFKSQADLFWETGEALSKVTNDTHRTYLAQKLLGRAGQQLLPIFRGTKEEIEAFRKKIQETSTVFSEGFIAKARVAALEGQVLSRMWQKAAGLITEQLLPAYNYIVDKLEKLAMWVQEVTKHSDAMNSMFAALAIGAGILTVQLAPLIATTLLWAAGLGLAFLVLEDFVAFLRGDGSLIGDFMDKFFGDQGGQDASRTAILDLWNTAKEFASWLADPKTWTGFAEAFNQVVRKILGETLVSYFNIPDLKAERLNRESADPNQDTVPLPPNFQYMSNPDRPTDRNDGASYTSSNDVEQQAIQNGRSLFEGMKFNSGFDNGSIDGGAPAYTFQGVNTLPQPMLPGSGSAQRAEAAPGTAPVINNNITVQGNATGQTAREIADRTGAATAATLGRGRDAIGAGVGLR